MRLFSSRSLNLPCEVASAVVLLSACSSSEPTAETDGSILRDSAADSDDAAAADAGDGSGDDEAAVDAGLCTSCGACDERLRITSAQHLPEPIDYPDLPPAGGDHAACWTSFGVHDTEVPDERWVHNLEHGAVVYLYHCPDGCSDELSALEGLAEGRSFVLVMPYAELPTRFAAVAWGQRLLSDCYDEAAFIEFYAVHANQAPESSTSPPPSGC